MKRGRPIEYSPELCDELEDWFNVEPYEIEEGKRVPNQLPTLINFARSKKIGISTIYTWIDKDHASFHQDFLDAYTRVVKHAQKEHIIQNGLQGLFTPQFAKFIAVNLTELKDQANLDVTTQGEKVTQSDTEIARTVAFLLRKGEEEAKNG